MSNAEWSFDGALSTLLPSTNLYDAIGYIPYTPDSRAGLWAAYMLTSRIEPSSREIAPGIWQHTYTPGFHITEWSAEEQERIRRYRKYQRRKAWGLAHKKRQRRR